MRLSFESRNAPRSQIFEPMLQGRPLQSTVFERYFRINLGWSRSPWGIEPKFFSQHVSAHDAHLEHLNWLLTNSRPAFKDMLRQGTIALIAGQPDKAERYLTKAAAQEPYLGPVKFLLGEAYRLRGNAAEAAKALQEARRSWSSCSLNVANALVAWHFGDWQEANESINDACRHGNVHPVPFFVQGLLRAAQGDLKISLLSFQKAKELSTLKSIIENAEATVRKAIASGTTHGVDCGINPLKIPTCITI